MQRKIAEHIGSLAFVAVVFAILLVFLKHREAADRQARIEAVAPYVSIPGIDFGNPRDRALFSETLNLFRPASPAANNALISAIESYRQSRFTDPNLKTGAGEQGLTWHVLGKLSLMYIQFVLVYGIVLALTFYGAQSLGIYRFVRMKQGRESYLEEFLRLVSGPNVRGKTPARIREASLVLLKAFLKGAAYAILFSPAYVIGYSFKASFETDSLLFMILLGVVSNGLLVNYANKFYTLLAAENRKGYVETALVKNLGGEYGWNVPGGIAYRSILSLPRHFPGHVLHHIYLNARHQYFPTMKEQASFLITGLIIIEMALNIQGHLCYELLQNILYRQYDVVLTILFAIFLLVKVTDILVDVRHHREGLRYENRN
jgi:hypothetical protein